MTKPRYLTHKPKTVALVGMGPSILDYMTETLTQEFSARFADEVWVINMASNCIWHDVVFWMDDLATQESFRPGLLSELRRRGKPVITSHARRDIIPKSYDYPISEVAQIIIPILGKGVKVLKVYGCDFTYPNRNYAEAGRACVETWLTIATMMGMSVAVAPSTSLMDAKGGEGIYGYHEQPEITLPDGTVFNLGKVAASEVSPGPIEARNYQPENSAGKDNGLHGTLPRGGSRGAGNGREHTPGSDSADGPTVVSTP